MDLLALRKFDLAGPDAGVLMSPCETCNIEKLSIGQVVFTAVCAEHGGMSDDGTVFRLGGATTPAGSAAVIIPPVSCGMRQSGWAWTPMCAAPPTSCINCCCRADCRRRSCRRCSGPRRARSKVAKLGWFYFTIARQEHFGSVPVMMSRTGFTGELGIEIFCYPKDAPEIFDAIWV